MKSAILLLGLALCLPVAARAESFSIVKGIGVSVNMPRVQLTKHMFLTADDKLITITCSVPIWPSANSQILYVAESKFSNQMVIGTQHSGDKAPREVSTDKVSSFEECMKTINTLMDATSKSPIQFSIEQDGPIMITR